MKLTILLLAAILAPPVSASVPADTARSQPRSAPPAPKAPAHSGKTAKPKPRPADPVLKRRRPPM